MNQTYLVIFIISIYVVCISCSSNLTTTEDTLSQDTNKTNLIDSDSFEKNAMDQVLLKYNVSGKRKKKEH